MLNENHITDILAIYLEKKNFKVLQKLNTGQKGVDLIVQDLEGFKHYIEVKGETSSKENSNRFGLPFDGKQIWNHISVALMKTIKTIIDNGEGNFKFGMAFPLNHEPLLISMLPVLNKLELTIYIVSYDEVRVLS